MIVVKEVFKMKGGWVKINKEGKTLGPFKNKTAAENAEFPKKKKVTAKTPSEEKPKDSFYKEDLYTSKKEDGSRES